MNAVLESPRSSLCWTEEETANETKLSQEFLRKDRQGKRLIPYLKIGRAVRYRPEAVRAALLAMEMGGTALRKGGR